jgi:hypothetical protein
VPDREVWVGRAGDEFCLLFVPAPGVGQWYVLCGVVILTGVPLRDWGGGRGVMGSN